MKINIDIKVLVIIVLLLVILFGGCWGKRKYDQQYTENIKLSLSNQNLTQSVNSRDQIITQQQVLLTENSQKLKSMTDSIFALKRAQEKKIKEVIAYYSERTSVKVDTVFIPYITEEDTTYKELPPKFNPKAGKIAIVPGSDLSDSTIKVPQRALLDTSGLHIDMAILKKGVRLNSFLMTDTQYIRVVELKHGWFKPRTLEIQTLHTNKALTVTGQNSVIYKPKKKSGWVLKVAILGAGIFLGTKL